MNIKPVDFYTLYSEKYGDATFSLWNIKFWIEGHTLAESDDKWERNLLNITIVIESANSSVISGEVIPRKYLEGWIADIQGLLDGSSNSVTLSSLEGVIEISIASSRKGDFLGSCEFHPPNTDESHTYQFELDRFGLQCFVDSCKCALETLS
jgi:hypothetical protein